MVADHVHNPSIEAAPICILDDSGKIIEVNRSMQQLLGGQAPSFQQDFLALIADQYKDLVKAQLENIGNVTELPPLRIIINGNSSIEGVLTLMKAPASPNLIATFNPFSQFRDNDQSKEDRLPWYEILQQIDDYVILLDSSGRIEYINRPLFDEQHLSPINSSFLEYLNPQNEQEVRDELTKVLEQKAARRFQVLRPSLKTAFLGVSARPRLSNQHEVLGATLILKNLTTSLQTRWDLDNSEAKSQALIASIPDMMFILDHDGIIQDYHAPDDRELYLKPEEFLGRPAQEFWPPEMVSLHTTPGIRAMETGVPEKYEFQLTNRSGQLRDFEARVQRVHDKAALYIVRDITDQKAAKLDLEKLNDQLEEEVAIRTRELTLANEQQKIVNQELSSFSYSVSHDLRAPLRAIMGFGSILKDDYAEQLNEDGKDLIETVLQNATRMGQLIDGILSYSRLTRKERVPTTLDMRQMFEEVFEDLGFTYSTEKVTFLLPDSLPNVEGDESMIWQVLHNILSNVIKYSSKEASPTIQVGGKLEPSGMAQYWVKDNGIGFDQAHVHQVFEVFQRLHSNDEFEGVGVGMAITHRIIRIHGGEIWAEGVNGEGATFFFTLPLSSNTE